MSDQETKIGFAILILIFIISACSAGSYGSRGNQSMHDSINTALSTELVEEYRAALTQVVGQDSGSISEENLGQLYFHIGNLGKDKRSMLKAEEIFHQILGKDPNNAEILAYLGTAYLIKARDFPMKWIANVTPLGFYRLHYVQKGNDMLSAAVRMDDKNPIIRHMRSTAWVNLPRQFGKFDEGFTDLELLLLWLDHPELNRRFAGLLLDDGFSSMILYQAGEAYLRKDDQKTAKYMFEQAAEAGADNPYGRAALRKLSVADLIAGN